MKNINEAIIEFSHLFENRLDQDLLSDAMSYMDHFEWGLAFETLCDYIAENDIKLNSNEYQKVLDIVEMLGLDLDDGFSYLAPENN